MEFVMGCLGDDINPSSGSSSVEVQVSGTVQWQPNANMQMIVLWKIRLNSLLSANETVGKNFAPFFGTDSRVQNFPEKTGHGELSSKPELSGVRSYSTISSWARPLFPGLWVSWCCLLPFLCLSHAYITNTSLDSVNVPSCRPLLAEQSGGNTVPAHRCDGCRVQYMRQLWDGFRIRPLLLCGIVVQSPERQHITFRTLTLSF